MNAAERMTVLCADGRKRAGERGDSESWEVWEDLEDLFGQVARVLENEPEATVRPFVSGMARALAATAAHASGWHHAPAVMADWLAGVPSSCWAPMGRRSAWCVRTATSTGTSC